jgi:hypothetical protein
MIPVLKPGCLALYDAFISGAIPCKVVSVTERPRAADGMAFGLNARGVMAARPGSDYIVRAIVTADHGSYRKGEHIESCANDIFPRAALRRHQYSSTIGAYRVECGQ